jgi:predicted DCC family thiol-disulfide oxidoreductase YuxK
MAELTVLYDEGCGFCTRLASWLARRPGNEAEPIGSETGSLLLRDLTPRERYAAVHVVDPRGRRRSGGAALPLLLRTLPGGSLPAAAATAFPALTERAYDLVARNRLLVSKLVGLYDATRSRAGDGLRPSSVR